MSAPLTIYRASAGAGKTFRLVVEYIKLLMLRPDEYRHILAVTFTIKATQEMKTRILSQLYGLREGLSSSSGYMKRITEEMGLSEEEVRKNAGKALQMILNDYSHFHIETIDSFFQRVLRNMTRELDISANMRVELNGTQVKDKAVDAMIENLEPTDHIFKRIEAFAEENMNDGKTWNIIGSLKDFGNNIFSNFYQSHANDYKQRLAANTNLFKDYKHKLYAIRTNAAKEIADAAKQLHQIFDDQGIDVSIFKRSNLSGLGKMFQNMMSGKEDVIPKTVRKYAEDEHEWFSKKDEKIYGTQIVTSTFMPALNYFLQIHERLAMEMGTCNVLIKNLNNLELLGAIEDAVDKSNHNANRFLLSSTNQLLSEMIADADSPFIYEKIGTQVRHLMIDEFQDTSTLQWQNFKHLLLESMSYYDAKAARKTVGSMIVGDVKQSIYRWRDGDWRLLNDIKSQFNDGETQIKTLAENYRSATNIVKFNNRFFLRCKDICGIERAYDDVEQKIPSAKAAQTPTGEIEFIMLSPDAYKSRQMLICEKVDELIQRGVEAKRIAILARTSAILKELSKTFMDAFPHIRVVSMESFQFNASTAVNIIICALKHLLNPDDRILLATIAKHIGRPMEESAELLAAIDKTRPLLDVVQDIFLTLDLEAMKDDSAFISAFFDYLKDFASKNTSTIRNFVKYWDEVICAKSIETEAADGVQMMTIHKSKGLEFDNVIIADGNWESNGRRNRIWVEIDQTPFNDIPFSIVQLNKQLANTIFKDDYEEECWQNTVDNLNLLYVAFTRAGKNLYFYGQTKKSPEQIGSNEKLDKYEKTTMSVLVEQCLDEGIADDMETVSPSTAPDSSLWDEGCYIKHFGIFTQSDSAPPLGGWGADSDAGETNVFELPIATEKITLHNSRQSVVFVQSNRSKDFVSQSIEDLQPSTSDSQPPTSNSYISTGLLLHNVLSRIDTIDDVEKVLKDMEMEGLLSDKKLANLIRKRITDNEYARKWFAPGWTVYNECPILTKESVKRPDRVITNGKETIVIDFKFGKPKPEHIDQVNTYKQLLEQIGMPRVSAYLWYVYENKVDILRTLPT